MKTKYIIIPLVILLYIGSVAAQVADLKGGPMGVERVAGRTHEPAYRSQPGNFPDTCWIQVDLGRSFSIEEVKLYPYIRDNWDRYTRPGFPLRFRIEASDEETFSQSVLITDQTEKDYEVTIVEKIDTYVPQNPVSGRYVRLTVTKPPQNRNKYYFDLWRFEVIAESRNVAENRLLSDSGFGYLGKHALLRPRRPVGEGVVYDHIENVTSPENWKPVNTRMKILRTGVRVGGLFKQALERNASYLQTSFSINDVVRDFRIRAGKPVSEKKDRPYEAPWVRILGGSLAGRYLMGAGNQLRWLEDKRLRNGMNTVIDVIEECADPDGYLLGFPERNILFCETGGYSRSWLTLGLIEAGLSGNPKAYELLRNFYDWFNVCPYLEELMLRGGFGIQGVIANTRTYHTPVGVPEDIQTVQRYYQMNFWLEQLKDRDPDALWQYSYDRSHCYLIVVLSALIDMYMATGDEMYLHAALGGWDLIHDYFEHTGGSIALSEHNDYPPKSYHLHTADTGELCGSSFWVFFNQQLRLLYPDDEKYANEIEKSIYNVALANQDQNGRIRYHARLIDKKKKGDQDNTCCEGQGTRLIGALPEFIYKIADDGIYVDLFNSSTVTWKQNGIPLTLQMESSFPEGPAVKLVLTTKKSIAGKVRIRVPFWASSAMTVTVNNKERSTGIPGSYIVLDRKWNNKDVITFSLPMDFRLVKYAGISKDFKGQDAYALEYGPLLMAVTGDSIQKGRLQIPLSHDELTRRLHPVSDKPLHFIVDCGNCSFEYKPYYIIDTELFTCYPFISRGKIYIF